MNDLKLFVFEGSRLRTVEIDGISYFIGADVATILGYSNVSDALRTHVDDEDRMSELVKESQILQNTNIVNKSQRMVNVDLINESGLYSLILSSRMPKAKKFKRWVTHEVIPSIRKTGSYQVPQTPEEKLKLTMEAATHLDQRLSTVEDEITDMKENAEIDSTQRYQLLEERTHRVMSIVGGKNSNYYLEHKANKVYAKMFADLKKVFKVPRYNALPKKDFERASKFIKNWYPDVVLKDEIDKANAQQRLEL